MNVHSQELLVDQATHPASRAVPEADCHSRRLSVLVVHDHDVVRSGFRLLLSQLPWIHRCLGARNVEEAITLWNRYEPHVALIDLFVGETPGTDLCARLRSLRPEAHVLLMSGSQQLSAAAAAAAGASGFISTGARTEELAQAIRAAGLGRSVSSAPPVAFGLLSVRQREVLRLMADGATNREIADSLYLSPHTVKGHTTGLYRRLRVRNRAEAVRRAQRVGLLV
jgi:DNA-binding NarL/FixJ family response regulator